MIEIRYPDEGEDVGDPWEIASDAGIRIMNNRELLCVARDGNTVVGGAWHALEGLDIFTFDIAVAEEYQRRGIGTMLMDAALDYYESLCAEFDDMKLEVTVVNDVVEEMLAKRDYIYAGGDGEYKKCLS